MSMGTEVMKRVKCRGLKMGDLNSNRTHGGSMFSGEESLSNTWSTADTPIRLAPPCKVGLWVNANELSHANPQVLLQRFNFSFTSSHPPTILSVSLPLSLSPPGLVLLFLSRCLLTEVSFQGPTNQAGLRHLCKFSSQ